MRETHGFGALWLAKCLLGLCTHKLEMIMSDSAFTISVYYTGYYLTLIREAMIVS
jgi:hypothetical protein